MSAASRLSAIASGLVLTGCSVFGIRSVEEPPYRPAGRVGEVEIRDYGPRLAAETVVRGDETGARSDGFRVLAAYIFGANVQKANISMTAPVAQSAGSVEIPMTAPVGQSGSPDGSWRIRFYMPASYSRDTLPTPTDTRVAIVTVPSQTVAVLRYAGIATAAAVRDADDRLLRTLNGSEWRAAGTPASWFYDPPWTLPPLRRNEAVVAVEPSRVP